MTTVGDYLQSATARLHEAGIETARLDCLVLMEDTLRTNRASLLAHSDMVLSAEQRTSLDKLVARRERHTPLAYIRGKAEFYGRTFTVSPAVLVPRPETEAIIALLTGLPLQHPPVVADIGTGSGCLAITSALERAASSVYAYDVSEAALAVARQNATALHASVTCIQSDLLQHYASPAEVIITNLPYVPQAHAINKAATFEPKLALFAGDNGLDLYRKLWQQIGVLHQQPVYVICESFPDQHADMATLAHNAGYLLAQTEGFAQQFTKRVSAVGGN